MLIAASLSIETFEVSRSRLRRTRHYGVCVSNRVLVPAIQSRWWVGTVFGGGEERFGALDSPSRAVHFLALATGAMGRTHLGLPGSPARVTSQEKDFARRSQVHALGCAGNVATREG